MNLETCTLTKHIDGKYDRVKLLETYQTILYTWMTEQRMVGYVKGIFRIFSILTLLSIQKIFMYL